MNKIRIGIIGTGAISHRHMKVWAHVPQVEIVAAAEIDEKKLKAWGEQYNVKNLYTDFREMLKRDDLDAIDVCVFNNLHAPISIAVMKAGIPCYCEKPMSASYYDSKLMYDCAKATGVKFAVQISSLFTAQTRIAKQYITKGELGEIYHAKSASSSYRRRPFLDFPRFSPAFQDTEMAGHGPIIDIGVYHMSMMLYLLGLPELESVYGSVYQKIPVPSNPFNKKAGVEDMGVGMAKFKGGLSLEFTQTNATNVENIGESFIAGTKGALIYSCVDEFGGDWSMGQGWMEQLPDAMQYKLRYVGLTSEGLHIDCDLKPYYNQQYQKAFDPAVMKWYDQQLHWYCYLTGDLTDETRYNTPLIALNASLLADGLVLSSEMGTAVTADEIKAKSKSLAMWKQPTPWGVFDYESTF